MNKEIGSSSSGMTGNISGRPLVVEMITKMSGSGQVLEVQNHQVMVSTPKVKFSTAFAARKFKKHFYRWSLKILEQARNFPQEVAAVQAVFVSTLDEIRSRLLLQGYTDWLQGVSELNNQEFVVKIFNSSSANLLRTFTQLDRFLAPVYAAHLAGKISKDTYESIKSHSELAFNTLRCSMDELLD